MKKEKYPARCVAVLGTGSDTGKSIVVAALCRIFNDLGISVAPFKAQNMSNNSYVTPEGGEMGRAQIVQAEAARIAPHVDMNPVLLKPSTNTGAQVVLHGKPRGNREAKEYFTDTDDLFGKALESLERLRGSYNLIVMEGAGSCAEVNLRAQDFVNFRMAHAADAPVILVADIDRGGVFAQIIGTLDVIPEEDRRRVQGIIINRFRGEADLFKKGIEYIETKTGLPVLGLIPYFRHIQIDSEDGVPLDALIDPPTSPEPEKINMGVIRLPHISNFTDFSPFERDESINLHYLARPRNLDGYDVIFIPGTKNVPADMAWLKNTGWADKLSDYVGGGGQLGGICGGYQMLGKIICDPYGIEGTPGDTECLGFLDVATTLHREKILTRSIGVWKQNGETVEGYEIHMGLTERGPNVQPLIEVLSQNGLPVSKNDSWCFPTPAGISSPSCMTDGAVSADGRVWGVYFHGLFDMPGFRHAFLKAIRADYQPGNEGAACHISDFKNRQYDLLAEHFRAHLDMEKLFEIAGIAPISALAGTQYAASEGLNCPEETKRTKDRGRIVLFTGEGKGKTTAALGMALRAAGHGMKVLIVQFVKSDQTTGEIAPCSHLPGVEIVQTGRGFVPEKTSPAFQEHCHAAQDGLNLANGAIASGKYDFIVLDEICLAVSKGLLEEKQVIDIVSKAGIATCVVMTGRSATTGLLSLADTVTEMHPVKHGFESGWKAQKGVEY